jgi:hypothetical protein
MIKEILNLLGLLLEPMVFGQNGITVGHQEMVMMLQ